MFEILYIPQLKDYLPYCDKRSLYQWLTRHMVAVYGDSKRQYVLAIQLKRAILQQRVSDLKAKHGEKWIEVLKSEMNLYAKYKALLDEIEKAKGDTPNAKDNVDTKGKHTKQFLLDINKVLELRSDQ